MFWPSIIPLLTGILHFGIPFDNFFGFPWKDVHSVQRTGKAGDTVRDAKSRWGEQIRYQPAVRSKGTPGLHGWKLLAQAFIPYTDFISKRSLLCVEKK